MGDAGAARLEILALAPQKVNMGGETMIDRRKNQRLPSARG
jgi:hypothetical protein